MSGRDMGKALLQAIQDFEGLRDPQADPELEAVKAALFLEDVFGIRLSDEDIGPNLLIAGAMDELLSPPVGPT
jgi:hypothetical protein